MSWRHAEGRVRLAIVTIKHGAETDSTATERQQSDKKRVRKRYQTDFAHHTTRLHGDGDLDTVKLPEVARRFELRRQGKTIPQYMESLKEGTVMKRKRAVKH